LLSLFERWDYGGYDNTDDTFFIKIKARNFVKTKVTQYIIDKLKNKGLRVRWCEGGIKIENEYDFPSIISKKEFNLI
jgi:hypothetical protein